MDIIITFDYNIYLFIYSIFIHIEMQMVTELFKAVKHSQVGESFESYRCKSCMGVLPYCEQARARNVL